MFIIVLIMILFYDSLILILEYAAISSIIVHINNG